MAKVPTEFGWYWAKWKIADDGTDDNGEGLNPDKWEIVEVCMNCIDETDPEYMRVAVAGVARSQSIENFYWGARITQPPG